MEFPAVTSWESITDIAAFADTDVDAVRVESQARAILVEFDGCARHFEVSYGGGCAQAQAQGPTPLRAPTG